MSGLWNGHLRGTKLPEERWGPGKFVYYNAWSEPYKSWFLSRCCSDSIGEYTIQSRTGVVHQELDPKEISPQDKATDVYETTPHR